MHCAFNFVASVFKSSNMWLGWLIPFNLYRRQFRPTHGCKGTAGLMSSITEGLDAFLAAIEYFGEMLPFSGFNPTRLPFRVSVTTKSPHAKLVAHILLSEWLSHLQSHCKTPQCESPVIHLYPLTVWSSEIQPLYGMAGICHENGCPQCGILPPDVHYEISLSTGTQG